MPVTATVEATFLGAVSLFLCAAWTDAQGAATPKPIGSPAERTEVCIGADSGCHIWTNANGSMETFYYKVIPAKYEFAHDRNGRLILLSHEHSPPLQIIDDGRYQCQILSEPTLCTPVGNERGRLPVQFGPDHRRSIDNGNGREDFWTVPGHQSLTDISNPAAWARVKATAAQYRPVDAVAHGVSLHSILTDPGVNTGVCLGATWGCHSWTNPDGSRENFNYKVILGKYEFAHDSNGQLILLSHEHAPPLQVIDGGRYQCRVQVRPTLCTQIGHDPGMRSLQFGPDHKHTINNSHGREDFWTLPGHQSMTDVSDPKRWAGIEAKAPQYSGY
jgi:hypothetical protein